MILRFPLLLSMLLSAAIGDKEVESTVTKQFHFKEAFYLTFHPLDHATGPDNMDVLMSALDDFGPQFKDAWIEQIEKSLKGGTCKVDAMAIPEFSFCDWRYPDRYDIDELPTPGQAYMYPDAFVQRLYFSIDELTITCDKDFSYNDLDQDAYMDVAFSGNDGFLGYINPPDLQCDGYDVECLFSTTESITLDSTSSAELHISRFTEIPLYLKCLSTEGFGPSIANKLIVALDRFFELYVEKELTNQIILQVPEASVYGFASPYASGRKFCSHGAYYNYAGGNLVNQMPDIDGILITKFTYGFDAIWFKPDEFEEELLPDIAQKITSVFEDGKFLIFLQEEYPDYEFIQDTPECNAIDIDDAEITLSPTQAPTEKPTSLLNIGEGSCTSDSQCATGLVCHQESKTCTCDIDAEDDDNGCPFWWQVCRYSCAFLTDKVGPKCFEDEVIRDCDWYGDGFTCFDANEDGVIDKLDKSSGCVSLPPNLDTLPPTENSSAEPTTYSPSTKSPSNEPTMDPSEGPTFNPVNPPTPFPIETTYKPTVGAIVVSETPTMYPSKTPSLIPTSDEPTSSPTDLPTSFPTDGSSETLGGSQTSPPTVSTQKSLPPTVIIPAITASPTPLPLSTSAPSVGNKSSCPNSCIIHPDDTEEDECPIATSATCGGGNRGDGICPFEGYCCSRFGWCGTTAEYCEDDGDAPTPSAVEAAAPTAPTYSLDAGQCGNGDMGIGLCTMGLCCSDWGYCGEGENYCYTTLRVGVITNTTEETTEDEATCGGGNVGNGKCRNGLCCSRFGFCGEDKELYCTGANVVDEFSPKEVEIAIDDSPLPDELKATFGFRCGVTEVDARSNCKKECTHHVQCDSGEECWGIQLNYCNTFEEGTHPICTDLGLADNDSRCGFDEVSARGHCGPKCDSDSECGAGEFCFPTLLNLCECNEEMNPEESSTVFAMAKARIRPYFLQEKDGIESNVEGKPRSGSFRSTSLSFMLATVIQMSAALLSYNMM